MGLFSCVIVPKELLREPYQNLTGWQTKDVIDPQMSDLEITKDGELIHSHWQYKMVDDGTGIFGWHMERTIEMRDHLDYHGDMIFYTNESTIDNDGILVHSRLIRLCARFTHGKLESIFEVE